MARHAAPSGMAIPRTKKRPPTGGRSFHLHQAIDYKRLASSSLMEAIALPGFKPLGQVLVQFMTWQR